MANCQNANKQAIQRLAFWNVENLFDTKDDEAKNDDAFTPGGENHWNNKRYSKKLNDIYHVLAASGEREGNGFVMPIVVGLAEVENDKVLRDLCKGTPLRKFGYHFVHYESPDIRGIDNALLYRKGHYAPFFTQAISVSDSSIGLVTRDILLVEGTTKSGDTLIVLVNHFPSKRGGAEAETRRNQVAKRLRYTMDTIAIRHPRAAIVVMGDLNAGPDEPEITQTLMKSGQGAFTNLMERMVKGEGSHKYQGNWSYLDQIIVSSNMLDGKCGLQVEGGKAMVLMPEFMMVDDETHFGKKPFRTYQAMKYLGGYSDHLPVIIEIK